MTRAEVVAYMASYAGAKKEGYNYSRDLGAFGDLTETLVRIALKGNYNLVHKADLHVANATKADIVHKGLKVEVGHNSKTWSKEDAQTDISTALHTRLRGGVIYGMMDEYTQNAVYMLCMSDRVDKAIELLSSYMVFFPSVSDFFSTMSNLPARGKFFSYHYSKRDGKFLLMNSYNAGLYDRFCALLDSDKVVTLYDYINRI